MNHAEIARLCFQHSPAESRLADLSRQTHLALSNLRDLLKPSTLFSAPTDELGPWWNGFTATEADSQSTSPSGYVGTKV